MPFTSTALLTPFLTGEYEPWKGKQTLKDVGIRLNGVDHSNYVHSFDFQDETEMIDITPLYSAPTKQYLQAGERQLAINLDMFFGNQPVDLILRTAYSTGALVQLDLSPHQWPAHPNNPWWTAQCIVTHMVEPEGDVGTAARGSASLRSSGEFTLDDGI